MFGFKRLKRRYRRFRYNNQARYPRLFVILNMLKLPFQLLLVAVPLWIVVAAYNDHFSYEAQQQHGGMVSGFDLGIVPEDESSTVAVVAIDRTAPVLIEGVGEQADANAELMQVEPMLKREALVTESNTLSVDSLPMPSLAASTASGPELLDNGDNVIVKSVPYSPIEELPDDGRVVTQVLRPESAKDAEVVALVEQLSGPAQIHRESSALGVQPRVRSAEWLVEQDDSSFVIQLESSANHVIMQQQARKLSTAGDLAIYPFVVSNNGEVIYGMSYGLYSTLEQAKKASTELPGDLVRFGTWIRQVGTLKRQMRAIDPERLNP